MVRHIFRPVDPPVGKWNLQMLLTIWNSHITLVLQWTIFLKSNFISAQIPSYLPSVQKKVSKLIGLCPYIQDIWEYYLTLLSSCVNWKIIVWVWVHFTNTRLNLPRHRHKSMNNKKHKNSSNIYDLGDLQLSEISSPSTARGERPKKMKWWWKNKWLRRKFYKGDQWQCCRGDSVMRATQKIVDKRKEKNRALGPIKNSL